MFGVFMQKTERRLQIKEHPSSGVRRLLNNSFDQSSFRRYLFGRHHGLGLSSFSFRSYGIKKMFFLLCVGSSCSVPPAGVARATSEFGFQAFLGNALTAHGLSS